MGNMNHMTTLEKGEKLSWGRRKKERERLGWGTLGLWTSFGTQVHKFLFINLQFFMSLNKEWGPFKRNYKTWIRKFPILETYILLTTKL